LKKSIPAAKIAEVEIPMSSITPQQFNELLPLACEWAREQEVHILANGEALSAPQMDDAKSIPVSFPEKVRLLKVSQIPMPSDPTLRSAAQTTGLISKDTTGLTLRYGVFVRVDCWGDRKLIAHELSHVAQYERLGGIRQFLQKYLHECVYIGYPAAPMEQEAIATADRICK